MALPKWGDPVWASQDLPQPEANYLSEAGMCVLDSGLVVLAGLTSESYSIVTQVVDPTKNSGKGLVGPSERHHGWDYGYPGRPIKDGLPPDSPYDPLFNDFSEIVSTGDYSFTVVGRPLASFNADGSYHAQSNGDWFTSMAHYTVDPGSLEVTYQGKTIAESSQAEWWGGYAEEASADRWGAKTVYITEYNPPGSYRLFLGERGQLHVDMLTIPMDGPSASDPSRPGPLAVSGNYAYFVGSYVEPGRLYRVNLNSGASTSVLLSGAMVDIPAEWTTHMCDLADGGIAMIYATTHMGRYSDVRLAIFEEDLSLRLDIQVPQQAGAVAQSIGWTGGWFSDVRSVEEAPDGTIVVCFGLFGYGGRGPNYYRQAVVVRVDPHTGQRQDDSTAPIPSDGYYAGNLGSTNDYLYFHLKAVPLQKPRGAVAINAIMRRWDYQTGFWYAQNVAPTGWGLAVMEDF